MRVEETDGISRDEDVLDGTDSIPTLLLGSRTNPSDGSRSPLMSLPASLLHHQMMILSAIRY